MSDFRKIWFHESDCPVTKEDIFSLWKREKAIRLPFVDNTQAVWGRGDNWSKPYTTQLIVFENRLVGIHMATFNRRNPYVNSFLLYVSQDCRGHGVGGMLFDWAIQHASENGQARWKCVCDPSNSGLAFYTGFGLKPIAKKGSDFIFDFQLEGRKNLPELIAKISEKETVNIGSRELNKYMTECDEVFNPHHSEWLIPV